MLHKDAADVADAEATHGILSVAFPPVTRWLLAAKDPASPPKRLPMLDVNLLFILAGALADAVGFRDRTILLRRGTISIHAVCWLAGPLHGRVRRFVTGRPQDGRFGGCRGLRSHCINVLRHTVRYCAWRRSRAIV